MTQNHNDQVGDHFALSARDWTPPIMSHAATVLYVPLSNNPEISKYCATILSGAERARAERFLSVKGADHFIERRAFRRYCGALALKSRRSPRLLAEVNFKETEKGRPYLARLPDIRFSFSACRTGFLGAWSETHRIGIDIEDHTRKLEASALAQRFFREDEARVVRDAAENMRLKTFYQFWCLKEAALKSIGEGLPLGLDAFEFALSPKLSIIKAPLDHGEAAGFNVELIEHADSCAAIVIHSST